MCGITGILNFNPSENVRLGMLKNMTDSINHRGPDDEGHYINNNLGLGFKRLSIIDLKSGHQPLSNKEKNIWITFNGEIYNYKSLRKELISKNYNFLTNSDTEVILNLYIEYGESCLKYLRGMFAFAIWDEIKNKLFVARDRLGIKPLYYSLNSNRLVWASEIKSILKTDIDPKLSLIGLDQYLTYGHTLRNSTIYKNIQKLNPGSYFSIEPLKSSKVKIKKYWNLEFIPDYKKSKEDFIEELDYELNESVKMRMISDVPLGAFLSGGIDSSSVVAMMSNNSDKPIKTFSIGFENQKFSELKYAKLVANKYSTDHNEFIVKPESVDLLPKLVKSYDEPFADSSAIPTYYLSKYTREHVTVALSGDGGDELFAGYSSYNKMIRLNKSFLKNKLIKGFLSGINTLVPDYTNLKKWSYYFGVDIKYIGAYLGIFKFYERNNLYDHEISNKLDNYKSENDKINIIKNKNYDFISKMQYLDMNTYLVDDILRKVDIASMSNSLEVRVPILDHKVVELATSIPVQYKINNSGQKLIFKETVKNYLPNEIFSHKKQGFSLPLSVWFKDDLRTYVNDSLNSSNCHLFNYLDKREVRKIVKNHSKGIRDYSAKIWSLLFLEEWLKNNNS